MVSPAQGALATVLVPSTPFGADCSVGAASGSDRAPPPALTLGFTVSASHQDGLVWLWTEATCAACHQTRQCGPSHSLPRVSKGLLTEVVRGGHLDPEALTQRMLKPGTFSTTELPGKLHGLSCLLGLGCAHLRQDKPCRCSPCSSPAAAEGLPLTKLRSRKVTAAAHPAWFCS